jgi:hypothetical protein
MPIGKPPFAEGRDWIWRTSNARSLNQRVWYDRDDGYEYFPDPRRAHGTWHQIDPRNNLYRDIDPTTGNPVSGSEGRWRPLK